MGLLPAKNLVSTLQLVMSVEELIVISSFGSVALIRRRFLVEKAILVKEMLPMTSVMYGFLYGSYRYQHFRDARSHRGFKS
jgi:hypothetical protein